MRCPQWFHHDLGFRVWRQIRSGRLLNDFLGTNIDVLNPDVLLASIANINTWEYAGHKYADFLQLPKHPFHSLYEASFHRRRFGVADC